MRFTFEICQPSRRQSQTIARVLRGSGAYFYDQLIRAREGLRRVDLFLGDQLIRAREGLRRVDLERRAALAAFRDSTLHEIALDA